MSGLHCNEQQQLYTIYNIYFSNININMHNAYCLYKFPLDPVQLREHGPPTPVESLTDKRKNIQHKTPRQGAQRRGSLRSGGARSARGPELGRHITVAQNKAGSVRAGGRDRVGTEK